MSFTEGLGDALSGASAGASIGSLIPGLGTGAGALIGAGVGLLGYFLSPDHADDAKAIFQKAQEQYGAVTADTIRRAAADVLGPTKLAEIQADPNYQRMQDEALGELKRISDSGGMTLEDKKAFNDALAANAQQQSQLRQAALQGMRSRGLNAAGAETQMNIAGQQAAANAANQAGTTALANAQQRALQALMSRGQMAGQMQQAKWGRDAQVAQAQDIINRLNWGNRQDWARAQMGVAGTQYGFAQDNANLSRQLAQQEQNQIRQSFGGISDFARGEKANKNADEGKNPVEPAIPSAQPAKSAVSASNYSGLYGGDDNED